MRIIALGVTSEERKERTTMILATLSSVAFVVLLIGWGTAFVLFGRDR